MQMQMASGPPPPRTSISFFSIGSGKYCVKSGNHECKKRKMYDIKDLSFLQVNNNKKLKLDDGAQQPREQTFWEQKQEKDLKTFFSRPKLALERPVYGIGTGTNLLLNLLECGRYWPFERLDPSGEMCKKRQRTDWWLGARKGCVTGSRLVNAIAMFGENQRMECWYGTYDADNKEAIAKYAESDAKKIEKGAECMAWGTFHEIDGLASFIHCLGDKLDFDVYETSLTTVRLNARLLQVVRDALQRQFKHEWRKDKDDEIWCEHFLKDSPDGLGRMRKTGEKFVIEIKAAYKLRDPCTYDKPPYYYYLQIQLHMMTDPQVTHGYLIAWSPENTVVWRIERDEKIWESALPMLAAFHKYGLDKTPPPLGCLDEVKIRHITRLCKQACDNAEELGTFPSVYSQHGADELEKLSQIKWILPSKN